MAAVLISVYRLDYLSFLDLQRVQSDAALGNSPLWFGEWALPTQFQASEEFLFKWADAQKLAYSEGAGWLVRCCPLHAAAR